MFTSIRGQHMTSPPPPPPPPHAIGINRLTSRFSAHLSPFFSLQRLLLKASHLKHLLPALALGFALFVAAPITANAQTAVTIDVSTLGGTNTDNSGTPAESQWRYNAASKRLLLETASGNYTLTGTNADLRVEIDNTATGASVTLNAVSITSTTTIALRAYRSSTVTLVGANSLVGYSGISMSAGVTLTITSATGGSLVAEGTGATGDAGVYLDGSAGTLRISGDAEVSAVATNATGGTGIHVGGAAGNSGTIEVGANAKLAVTSTDDGITALGALNLIVAGELTVEGADSGLLANEHVGITGSGSASFKGNDGVAAFADFVISDCAVSVENGTSMIIPTSTPIRMNDAAKLTLINSSAVTETIAFVSTNVASTLQWRLTGDVTTGDTLTDATINVTVAANGTGTIDRAAPTPVTWSGLSANGTSGSVTTTQLTLTFDVDPTTLTADDITVTNATKGVLSGGPGPTRTLNISNITVANGANVTVAITNPAGFTITPTSRTVAVYVAASPLTFTHNAAFDIPASTLGRAIVNINVANGVSGGTPPYTFSAAGLPAGISISSAGVISGAPTVAGAAGTATITVTDNAGASQSITIAFGAIAIAPLASPTTSIPALGPVGLVLLALMLGGLAGWRRRQIS